MVAKKGRFAPRTDRHSLPTLAELPAPKYRRPPQMPSCSNIAVIRDSATHRAHPRHGAAGLNHVCLDIDSFGDRRF
jgi:hypothetical protein